MRPSPSLIGIVAVLSGLLAAPIYADDAKPQALVFSPWVKFCGSGQYGKHTTCVIGRDARTKCGSGVASAVLIEQAGESKKILRVVLPVADAQRGVRITIDQGQPATLSSHCLGNGCMGDHEASADLVVRLRQGQTLTLEAVDPVNGRMRVVLPLAGFAKAYDGPPTEIQAFEGRGSLEDVQRRAEEEKRKLAECEAGQ
jgi:invasion protein IalB